MRRVVVTGVGLVTPCGVGTRESWDSLVNGRSGIGPITRFDSSRHDTHFAGEVKGFEPEKFMERKKVKESDLFIQFALASARMAMDDAGLGRPEAQASERWGSIVGVGLGGLETIEGMAEILRVKGPGKVSPYFIPRLIANLAPGQISIVWGLKGPNLSTVSACSSGAHAVGDAANWIRGGAMDVMVTGGTEATITPLGVGGFNAMKALSTRNESPAEASRPFERDRDGFIIAEGSGILVLEELEHAKKRGANIYGEFRGYGSTSDAFHLTQPAPEGEGAARCMRMALRDARLEPRDIGYINAHGTSTQLNDKNETLAIKHVFGDVAKKVAISSTKSMTGHTLGAAGGIEAIVSCLVLRHGILPPTINYVNPDPACDLDYVPNRAREVRVDAVLSNSFGFGGTNACLVFTRYKGD